MPWTGTGSERYWELELAEPRLSLVIPCYNEARNLPLLVERCRAALARPNVEVVLVDNGSTDGTPEVLRALLRDGSGIRAVRVECNQGYGFGILEGLRAARGEVLAWTHADMQTDPADALAGLAFFENSDKPAAMFVKGRRYGRPLADRMFTLGMAWFESILFSAPFRDINAQPTMFHRDFFADWDDPPKDFSLDLYAYYMAHAKSLQMHRFPVRFGERAHGHSHWNVNWQGKLHFIKRTLDYSFKLKKRMRADMRQHAGWKRL